MKDSKTEPVNIPEHPEMLWDKPRIKVAMVEDSSGFGEMLAACLEHQPEFEFQGEVRTVQDAVKRLPLWKPNIVLLDLGLPDGTGIDVLRALSPTMTQSSFIILTVFEDDATIREALSSGAVGYMLKRSGWRSIVEGVKLAAGGGSPLDAQIARRLLEVWRLRAPQEHQKFQDLPELTAKENELMRQMAATGDSVKHVSEAMGLTYATVRTYIRRIYVKLGVHNRSQAERKLLSLNQDRAQQTSELPPLAE
ncbi:MAG: response regulator transcription factor [Pedosphaera sp.]|nr:response regulator transcription factor [Pedosphaera sp.]